MGLNSSISPNCFRYGQVSKIENIAADSPSHVLNHVRTNLESPGSNLTDAPRLGETRTYVENFNSGQETVVTNTLSTGHQIADIDGTIVTAAMIQVAMQNHPTGNITNTYVGETGWREGLPILVNDYADEDYYHPKRSSWTKWTQDDVNSADTQNPRVTETKIGDGVNLKRSTIDYLLYPSTTISKFGLVEETRTYASDQSTVLKRSEIDYNFATAYTDRRIIGLPVETRSYGWNDATSSLELASKMTYAYDEEDFEQETNQIISPIRHDTGKYGSDFITGRGNLTSVTRHDVLSQSSAVTSRTRYDIAGSVVSKLDPLGRKVRLEYTDVFNDLSTPGTFAYPTKVYNPANNFSEVIYRFDIGANVWAGSPAPAGNAVGKQTERLFDDKGRLEKETILNTGAYTRYEYPTNGIQSKVFSTIIDTNGNGTGDLADEVLSESWSDGAGRVRRSRTEHPGSVGGYSGSLAEYDILGRVKRSTVPTEINSSWQPTGDDDRGPDQWLWNSKEYDWMGRPTRTINTDGTDTLASYEGCGCAGGLVTTIQGDLVPRDDQPTVNARRTQKVYADILGRNYKTEMLDWNGAVYKSSTNTYNGSDQTVSSREIAGSEFSTDFRETTLSYDGFGRVKTFHSPEQDANKFTSYTYTVDHKPLTITDARGAVKHFQYNDLGMIQQISYDAPSELPIVYTKPIMTHASGNIDGSIYKFFFKGVNIDANAEIKAVTLVNGQQYTFGNLERGTDNDEVTLKVDLSSNSTLYNYINGNSPVSLSLAIVNPDTGKKSLSALANYSGSLNVFVFPPQSIPRTYSVTETPTVTYTYNNLGMRTGMIDGSGSVGYEYNSLGQMTAETRTFNETPPITPIPNNNSFRIEYTYGLSGQLTSYKEPFGEIVSYTHDKTGRLKTVSGNRTIENVQLNYVTNTEYRAWGAAKEVAFIGGRNETSTFNAGLQVSDYVYSVSSGASIHLLYNYFDDGKLKNSSYLANMNISPQNLAKFDRSYEYDFLGRLKDAKTGAEARGQIETNPLNRPYRMTLEYNQFNDITSQSRLHYEAIFNSTFDYEGARNTHEGGNRNIPGWVSSGGVSNNAFDADGRSLGPVPGELLSFDAEGHRSSVTDFDTATAVGNISVKYDGDGRKIKTAKPYYYYCNGTGGELCLGWAPHYYILSTVLGQVVDDLEQGVGGGKERNTKIIGNGNRIAERRMRFIGSPSIAQEATFLQRADPSGVEIVDRVVHTSGPWNHSTWGDGTGTVDPFGAGVGYENPYPPEMLPPTPDDCPTECECDFSGRDGEPPTWECEMDYDDQSDQSTETGNIPQNTCYVDGVETDCSRASELLESGDAYQCPPQGCSMAVRYNGKNVIANYNVFDDGFAGYVPLNSTYAGNGYLTPLSPVPPSFAQKGAPRNTDLSRINNLSTEDIRRERDLGSAAGYYPWFLPSRRLGSDEANGLRSDVNAVLNDGDCLKFIEKLLSVTASITPLGRENYRGNGSPQRLLSGNVMKLFDDVGGMGGFRIAPLGGISSVRGTLAERNATVWLGGKDGAGNFTFNPTAKDGTGRSLSQSDQLSIAQQSMRAARTITTIHELLHFNFSDEALATGVAEINKTRATHRNMVEASRNWMAALKANCPTTVLR